MVRNKPKNRLGRPYIINEVAVIMLEHALKYGDSVAGACRYAQIGRTAYYSELARNKEFAERMRRAKSYLIIKAKLIIADAIFIDRDPKIAMWFLSRRDPDYM